MAPLTSFPLPLQSFGPLDGYEWSERSLSELSTTSAFKTGIEQRDTFLGKRRCIICGSIRNFEHCHIIMDSEPDTWEELIQRRWIPEKAKSNRHEPRNGLLMCSNHHGDFDNYRFFIRFVPEILKFVFVNYSDHEELRQFHGKAVALDIKDRHAPFPAAFIIHEMRARGFNPWQNTTPEMPDIITWQDWVLSRGVISESSGSFIHASPPHQFVAAQPPHPNEGSAGGGSSGGHALAPLSDDVIADILAATRASLSWRTCEIEGTSWVGTTEENIQKYVSSVGLEP